MATYFVFSDESGKYQEYYRNRGHRYFVRSALLFNSENWIELKNGIDGLKTEAEIPVYKEFKWNYIWPIMSYQNHNCRIKETKGPYPFRNHDIDTLIGFVRKSISLFHKYEDSKIIYTFTENVPVQPLKILMKGILVAEIKSANPKTRNIYKWHLQELMQRVEMEIQDTGNLAVLFFDQEESKTETHLRNSYNDIYYNGDFIEKYKHIKDSLCFEHSHHSTGIQIADYIAGIFNAFLNDDEISYALMKDCILPILRKDSSGHYLGYGIREVLRNESKREILRQKIKENLLDKQTTSEQDMSF